MTKQLDLYGKTIYRLIDPTWEGRAEELKKQGYARIPRSRGSRNRGKRRRNDD
jgi:hypothetical protein